MKILNLYAGIGGNRKLWPDNLSNGEPVEITAVELNPKIAAVYKHFFPKDNVVVGDAEDYLLKHFKEFNFIWASPPCQTHSRLNYANAPKGCVRLPDITRLYGTIIFLQTFFKQDWVIENVKPYYRPLIPPTFIIDRHYFWGSKFIFTGIGLAKRPRGQNGYDEWNDKRISRWQQKHQINISQYNLPDKGQVLRNCVSPEIGKYIFDAFFEKEAAK
jgi:DNA (cytosine-5)-methyltransferase 1